MENKNYIIKLKDGGVLDIDSYDSHTSGCPTCDYGAEYINELYLTLATMNIEIETNSGNGYVLTTANTIKLFAKDFSEMTEFEFSDFLKKAIQDLSDTEIKCTVTERK